MVRKEIPLSLIFLGVLVTGSPFIGVPKLHWKCSTPTVPWETYYCLLGYNRAQDDGRSITKVQQEFRNCTKLGPQIAEVHLECIGYQSSKMERYCHVEKPTSSPVVLVTCTTIPFSEIPTRLQPVLFCPTTPSPSPSTTISPATTRDSTTFARDLRPYCEEEVVSVSAAVWKAGSPLKIIIIIGSNNAETAGVTLTTPSKAVYRHGIDAWHNITWKVEERDLAQKGPPDWIMVLTQPRCLTHPQVGKFHKLGILTLDLTHEIGNYFLTVETSEARTLVFSPLITGQEYLNQTNSHMIGSHVLKTDIQERILIRPQMSLKEIRVSLAGLNTTRILPQCTPYLKPSNRGWEAWLQLWNNPSPPLPRVKRSISDWVAPAAGGAALLDAANIEVLANKFALATSRISDLGKPVAQSLTSVSKVQHSISSILVDWESQIEQDFAALLQSTSSLQKNISLAMACTQAQHLNLAIAMGMIRQATEGHLPLEIKKLITPKLIPLELELEPWWSLINSSFDMSSQELRIFLLTASAKESFHIFPVIPLGLQVGTSEVLYASHPDHWATATHNGWELINVQGCTHKENMGYICEDQAFAPHHPCVAPQVDSPNQCSYDLIQENGSAVVYVGQGCACIRSPCDFIVINSFHIQPMLPWVNRCFCSLHAVVGCDFSFTVPVWTQEEILASPLVYRTVEPVSFGMGLDLIQELLAHPQLHNFLQTIKQDGGASALLVSHNTKEILDMSTQIKQAGEHSWWETLFGWSPTATSVLNLALHPIVVILIFQILLCISLVALGCWGRRQLRKLRTAKKVEKFQP